MSQNSFPDIANARTQLLEGIGHARRMAHDCGVLLQQIGEAALAEPDRERADPGED